MNLRQKCKKLKKENQWLRNQLNPRHAPDFKMQNGHIERISKTVYVDPMLPEQYLNRAKDEALLDFARFALEHRMIRYEQIRLLGTNEIMLRLDLEAVVR